MTAKQDGANSSSDAALAPQVQARILAEALPHLIRYDEQTVVIKFGGHAMGDQALADAFAQDIVYLKQSGVNPIVVHGGGPQIAKMLKKLEIKSDFVHGLRVTDKPTVESRRDGAGGRHQQGDRLGHQPAGRQGGRHLRQGCQPYDRQEDNRDAGPGIPTSCRWFTSATSAIRFKVNYIVDVISKSDLIPVIAPIGVSREGQTLNINADTFASALAARMKAARLLLLTDVEGVLDKNKNLIQELTVDQARALIGDGTITGGMIPKIEGCIEVVEAGVEAVVIINGKVPHCVLL